LKAIEIQVPLAGSDGEVCWEELLFAEEHVTRIYQDILKFPSGRLLEVTRTPHPTRVVQVVPDLRVVSSHLASLLGRKFSYTETGRLERGVYRFRAVPSIYGNVAFAEGTTAVSADATSLNVRLRVEARVPLVGGAVEEAVLAIFSDAWLRLKPYAKKHIRPNS
jgi:Protein of unknown function (DUF2505)